MSAVVPVSPRRFPGLTDTDRVCNCRQCGALLMTSSARRPDAKPYQDTADLPAVVYAFKRQEGGHRVPTCRACARGNR